MSDTHHTKPPTFWNPKHAFQPDARPTPDGSWTLSTVRDFYQMRKGELRKSWITDVTLETSSITRTWFLFNPFSNALPIAHPYILFELTDGECIGVTIEGRRPAGDSFSIFYGSLGRYTLGYIWATTRDLITTDLEKTTGGLFLSPLSLTAQESQALAHRMAERTHTLHERAVPYSAVARNCVSVFYNDLRLVRPTLPRHWSEVATGGADRFLHTQGLVDIPARDMRGSERNLIAHRDEIWTLVEQGARPLFTRVTELLTSRKS